MDKVKIVPTLISSRLKGKVAIVTGASGGIGRATAFAFARESCNVVVVARSTEKINQIAADIKASYNVKTLAYPADVSDYNVIKSLGPTVNEQFGSIDFLVNNAGIGLFKSLEDATEDEMKRVLDVNLLGAMYCAQSVVPFMKKQNSGHIINVSSVAGRRAFAQLTAYCASKYGMIGFSDSLRTEFLKAGIPIHVTVICPPAVKTDFFTSAGYHTYEADHPLVTLLDPNDVSKEIIKVALKPGKWEIHITPRARILNFLNKLSPKLIEYLNRKAAKAVNKK